MKRHVAGGLDILYEVGLIPIKAGGQVLIGSIEQDQG